MIKKQTATNTSRTRIPYANQQALAEKAHKDNGSGMNSTLFVCITFFYKNQNKT